MNGEVRQAAKRALEEKGWSQQELAAEARVKQATVSRLLAGERQGEPATWQRLLDALGLRLAALPKEPHITTPSSKEGE
jgi:ribosome-binding protein aMBF1 (putative translation factor)